MVHFPFHLEKRRIRPYLAPSEASSLASSPEKTPQNHWWQERPSIHRKNPSSTREDFGLKTKEEHPRSSNRRGRHERHRLRHDINLSIATIHDYEFFEKDPHYLLRLAQQNDWRNVEKCCYMLSKVVRDHADENPPSAATQKLLIAARIQVLETDPWGNSALHIVCYHKPPDSIVSALITAMTNVLQGTDQQIMPNQHGSTPLLIACRSGACQRVIQMLLADASLTLLHPDYRAVYLADLAGNTAFSGLVQRYTMLCKIPFFKRYCVLLNDMALEVSTDERTPAGRSAASDEDTPHPEHHFGGYFLERNQDPTSIFPTLWETVGCLMNAAWNDCNYMDRDQSWKLRQFLGAGLDSSSWLDHPIHAAAFVADALPQIIVDLLFRWKADKVWTSDGEVDDNTMHDSSRRISPLSLAVIRQQPWDAHADMVAQRAHMIHRLLTLHSSVATSRMPNNPSRWAFHQAIASGLTWHIRKGENKVGPLQEWFHLAPDLIRQRDAETGLFPFQLAAVSSTGAMECGDLENGSQFSWSSRAQVDTIFHLLKEAPELIQ